MIRPTFMGFEVAKKGFTVSQKGLDITGQNLVNWDSEGYTRQRIEQVAISQDSYRTRMSSTSSRIGLAGQGVDIATISQQRDSFLDKRYREQYGDVGYYDKSNDILDDIQDSLDLLDADGEDGLRARLMALRDSLDTLAGSSDSPTHANIVATNVRSFARTLQQLDQKLTRIQEQHTYDMSVEVDDYNDMLSRVAEINRVIMEDGAVIGNDARYKPNELYDERNVLIDKLSNMTDLDVTENVDGTVTLTVPSKAGGDPDIVLVQGKKHETLDMNVNENTGVVTLRWLSNAKPAKITTGTIKASYDYINGRGEGSDSNILNAGETPVRGVPYYKDQLDRIAQQFADVMNSTIPASYKVNADGKPDPSQGPETDAKGNVIYKKLVGTSEDKTPGADTKVTAANISISYEWSRDSNYVMTLQGDLDTTHILHLKDRLNSEKTFKAESFDNTAGDPDRLVEEGSTFLEFFKSVGTTLGSDISYNNGRYEASTSLADSLNDRRDSVAGVNVDEETANMMMYNKSLSAASRLMTTLDDALDILINRTGRVGL